MDKLSPIYEWKQAVTVPMPLPLRGGCPAQAAHQNEPVGVAPGPQHNSR